MKTRTAAMSETPVTEINWSLTEVHASVPDPETGEVIAPGWWIHGVDVESEEVLAEIHVPWAVTLDGDWDTAARARWLLDLIRTHGQPNSSGEPMVTDDQASKKDEYAPWSCGGGSSCRCSSDA